MAQLIRKDAMRKLLTFLIALGAIAFGVCSPAFAQGSVHVDAYYVQFHEPYLAGNWQIGGADTLGPGASSSTPGANSIHCYPGFFYDHSTIGALGARINTISASGNLQLAIYDNNQSTHRPIRLTSGFEREFINCDGRGCEHFADYVWWLYCPLPEEPAGLVVF
jgi:hypothetical protein